SLRPKLDFLEETMSGLEELARQVRRYRDSLEDDPRRLEEIEVRLELIRNLKRKYGQTIAEILDYRTRAEKELADLTTTSERRARLQETRKFLRKEMGHLASELSQARAQAAQRLVAGVKKELGDLNLAQVEFEVSLTQEKSPEGIPLPGSDTYAFSNEGVDVVEFLVSTNPGEPVKPLAKIASTGEISRFALALKGALAEADRTPVLIFDEIDIGVGGRSGEVIGKKLWLLARNHQVICVTHLPQIGAFADAHFSVRKEASGSRTTSTIEPVQGNARLKELAAMLAGARYSETALKGARELIEKAEQWKALNRKHIGNTS
ncbi:MAG: DNA repair protein RecN, partial [Chloroflexota bacterium]